LLACAQLDIIYGCCEAAGARNWIRNWSAEESNSVPRWIVDTQSEFAGLMKLMALVMRGGLTKQTPTIMENFKTCAESTKSGVQSNGPHESIAGAVPQS